LYRARDTRLGRTVFVRLLPPDRAPAAADRTALVERIRTLIPLSHPNITAVFEAGEHEGRVFVASEFVRGHSLRAEMAGHKANVRRAVELAIQIADALGEAHAAGFVHGALTAESILVTARGHAKISAFDPGREAAGGDDTSDIHAVGAFLYEMLTARRPPDGGASAPSAWNPDVPKELDAIVLRAIAPNAARRYQDAATLAAELRTVIAILDVREDAAAAGAGKGAVSGATTTLLAVIAVAIVLALVIWFMQS
jgi:eukaryotic-like serine/threonine-protein kinase